MKSMLKVALNFIMGSMCFMQVLQVAKAQENHCFFPAYEKEARFCNIIGADKTECEEAKLESGYGEFKDNIKSLFDDVEYETFSDSKISIKSFNIYDTLIEVLSFSEFNPEYDKQASDSNYNVPEYKDINESTDCDETGCTTQGYDDNDRLIFEANCIEGINHGKQIKYTESGEIEMELNYNNGKLDGIQKLPKYNEGKLTLNEVEIKDSKLNGKLDISGHRRRDKNLKIGVTGEFKNGKPISTIRDYSYNAKKGGFAFTSIYPFDENSNLNGVSFSPHLYYGGMIANVEFDTYENNKLISSEVFQYYNNGKNFKCRINDYVSYAKYDNMMERKTQYSNCFQSYFNKFEGIKIDSALLKSLERYSPVISYTQTYFNAGEISGKEIVKEVSGDENSDMNNMKKFYLRTTEQNYKNNELNGVKKSWINGKLAAEENYTNGKANGVVKEWYENGKLKSVANVKNDKLNGVAKAWHENGKLAAEENYTNGKANGVAKEWDTNGRLIKSEIYKDGKLVRTIR